MLPLGLGVAVKNVGQREMSVRQRGAEQGRHPGDLDVARAERIVHGALSPRAGGQLAQAEEEKRIVEPGLRFGVRPAPYRFPEPLGERPQAVLIVLQVGYRDFDLGIRRGGMLLQPKSRPLPAQPERCAEHRHGGKEQAAPSASSGRGF